MAKLNEYLTIAKAAAFLGVSKDTLRRWDRAAKLKARRHPASNYRLYLKRDLERFMAGVDSPAAGSANESPPKRSRVRESRQ